MVAPNEDLGNDGQRSINLEITDEVAQGEYANFVLVAHSPTEFVIDFARILPGPPKSKVSTRIIMAPQHAKALIYTLQDNLAKYEKNFGPVKPLPQLPPRSENF
jgi:Protein of unknown function (DUF3467)